MGQKVAALQFMKMWEILYKWQWDTLQIILNVYSLNINSNSLKSAAG